MALGIHQTPAASYGIVVTAEATVCEVIMQGATIPGERLSEVTEATAADLVMIGAAVVEDRCAEGQEMGQEMVGRDDLAMTAEIPVVTNERLRGSGGAMPQKYRPTTETRGRGASGPHGQLREAGILMAMYD